MPTAYDRHVFVDCRVELALLYKRIKHPYLTSDAERSGQEELFQVLANSK